MRTGVTVSGRADWISIVFFGRQTLRKPTIVTSETSAAMMSTSPES